MGRSKSRKPTLMALFFLIGYRITKEQGKYKGRKKVYSDFDTGIQKWRDKNYCRTGDERMGYE